MDFLYSIPFLGAILGGFGVLILPIFGVGLWIFLRQRKRGEETIPPLDLVDAKKLDDMVSKQIQAALKPMLRSDGYSDDQIRDILTRTSSGVPFRR
jgi:hypothetical protein